MADRGQLNLRRSDEEEASWRAAAERAGMTLAAWIRLQLNAAAAGAGPLTADEVAMVREVIAARR